MVHWAPEAHAEQAWPIWHALYGPPKSFKLSVHFSMLPQGGVNK